MKQTHIIRMRGFSFAIPATMDGMLGMVQVALPVLLTVDFHVSSMFLGKLSGVAQSARLPMCLGAGSVSEKIGRSTVILPSAIVAVLACIGLALARNTNQIFAIYVLLMISIGAFYPVLQAFIGDRSPQGELRKNLSAFNVGWTLGGSVCGMIAGYLLVAGRALPFALGAVLAAGAVLFFLAWARSGVVGGSPAQVLDSQPVLPNSGPGPLLLIARMGHFLGFFGYAAARNLFPKLGVHLNYGKGEIGLLVAMLLVGQALGIFISSAGPWWRGKLWPQILAQGLILASALAVFIASSRSVFAAAFLAQGIGLSIAYTGALYYGLQARTNMGRNTGIHESLVAAGNILGSFAAGAAAQYISVRAPYLVIAGLAGALLLASLVYWSAFSKSRPAPQR